ncbi:hypothetical protein BKA63DRAFT_601812 [Paraphoma chrysanthemicola]|nr:hypothetical protein BKA63DRAFT_601812 [Paraphoma chrysanthemicola]
MAQLGEVAVVLPLSTEKQKAHLSPHQRFSPDVLQWRQNPTRFGQLGLLIVTIIALAVTFSPWTVNINLVKSIRVPDVDLESSELWKASPYMRKAQYRYEKCSSVAATTSRYFEANVTSDGTDTQWKFFDSTRVEAYGPFRGQVNVRRGDPFQVSDITILVLTKSTNEEDLQNVIVRQTRSDFTLKYVESDAKKVCTEVEVYLFLRPRPAHQVHLLAFQTHILDVSFDDGLEWEVENLLVQTSRGEISFENAEWGFSHGLVHASRGRPSLGRSDEARPITSNNITLSSTSGDIGGYIEANGHIDARSETGWIGLGLIPPRNGIVNLKNISVHTLSGTIHFEVPIPYWPPQPHTHVTNIHSVSGEVWAYLPQGLFTNLTSDDIITTAIVPYRAASSNGPSEIHTSSRFGPTRVRLQETNGDSSANTFSHDPLLTMMSSHYMKDGRLDVLYPRTWLGTLEARIDDGPLKFESGALEEVERGEGYIKARRGTRGHSQAQARVEQGEINIELGTEKTGRLSARSESNMFML